MNIARPSAFPPAFVFIVGLATILGAWAFQTFGGYIPCKLCLEERIPYYVGLPFAFVALMLALSSTTPPWMRRVLLVAVAIIFAYGAWLGTYHAGAEWSWWEGPSDCGAGAGTANAEGNLLDQLKGIRIVSCTEASWRFPDVAWGLSFAGWNAAISALLAVVAAWGASRK